MPNPWKLTTLLFATTTLLGVAAAEPQPLMRDALTDLRQAATRLEQADHDKGGHRAKALEYTRAAIREVEEGVRFDNRH
jgi:hypothetical protein